MYLLVFLFLLSSVIIPISIQSFNCSELNDCFTCTGEEICIWLNAQCVEDVKKEKNSDLRWFQSFPSYCQDLHSSAIMDDYCFDKDAETVPLTAKINLESKSQRSTIEVLYCKWSLKFSLYPKDLMYSFDVYNKQNQNSYHLVIRHTNGTMVNRNLMRTSTMDINDVVSIDFMFYTTQLNVKEEDFVFRVTEQTNVFTSKEFIISCSCFGIFILLFIVIGIIAYFLRKRMLSEHALNSESHVTRRDEDKTKQAQMIERNTEVLKCFFDKFSSEKSEMTQICMICIENLKGRVTTLPCSHIFHHPCIEEWCLQAILNPKCPCCNFELLNEARVHLKETALSKLIFDY